MVLNFFFQKKYTLLIKRQCLVFQLPNLKIGALSNGLWNRIKDINNCSMSRYNLKYFIKQKVSNSLTLKYSLSIIIISYYIVTANPNKK